MTETPTAGGTAVPPANEGTGTAADAAPVDATPTDQVDHEGTGPGVNDLPPSNTTADVETEVDGSDNA